MKSTGVRLGNGGLLLLGALWAGAAGAQSTGTGAQGTGTGQSTGATINNAPVFDPARQAAARLLGVYRVPGAPQLDPSATYRVPGPDTSGGSAGASTSTTTTTTTSASTTSGGSATASTSP